METDDYKECEEFRSSKILPWHFMQNTAELLKLSPLNKDLLDRMGRDITESWIDWDQELL